MLGSTITSTQHPWPCSVWQHNAGACSVGISVQSAITDRQPCTGAEGFIASARRLVPVVVNLLGVVNMTTGYTHHGTPLCRPWALPSEQWLTLSSQSSVGPRCVSVCVAYLIKAAEVSRYGRYETLPSSSRNTCWTTPPTLDRTARAWRKVTQTCVKLKKHTLSPVQDTNVGDMAHKGGCP